MATTIEAVTVSSSKEDIKFDLLGYSVDVLGSQLTEDGWLLMFEGEASEVDALVLYWQDAGVLCVRET